MGSRNLSFDFFDISVREMFTFLARADSDPLDEPDEADALLLDAPLGHLADAAAHGRGAGTDAAVKNSEFTLWKMILQRKSNFTM